MAIILKRIIRSTRQSDVSGSSSCPCFVLFIRIAAHLCILQKPAGCGIGSDRSIGKRPIWCAPSVEVNNMRIICDQCNQPISGTVKRVTGNFNLHPHCLTQFIGELNTARLSTRSVTESSIPALVRSRQNALASLELVPGMNPPAECLS